MEGVTRDDLLYGRLRLWQPAAGPRVSMDTVLLAAWVRLRARRPHFVELGSASGAVSLMLALRFPPPFDVVGLELQPELVELAERNRNENGLQGRVRFLCGDLRDASLLPRESFDGLVVNPPYETPGRGRVSPLLSRAIARHGASEDESACCTLQDVAVAGARLLKRGGRLFCVLRTDRMASLMAAASAHGLAPKRMRLVHPRPSAPSNLLLLECARGGGEGMTVEPPIFVLGADGRYTEELLSAYGPSGLNSERNDARCP